MELRKCERCGRLVAAERRVRGLVEDGRTIVKVEVRPLPHLESQTADTLTVCEARAA